MCLPRIQTFFSFTEVPYHSECWYMLGDSLLENGTCTSRCRTGGRRYVWSMAYHTVRVYSLFSRASAPFFLCVVPRLTCLVVQGSSCKAHRDGCWT